MNRILLVLVFVFSFTCVKAQNFSTHNVKEGETVEGLAKRYYVPTSEIYKLNPDAKKGLKPNTILIIPISKAEKPETTTTVTREFEKLKPHRVKRKETLYSLAKMYDVEEADIKKYNTFLYSSPLRKGDKIDIPVYKTVKVVEEVSPTKTYTVLPKEGKWRVAYKFGITLKELETLNPDMGEVLKEGQVLNVPNVEDSEEKEIDEKYSYYKVLPKEGFYRLKLKLNLEQSEIEALNPGLAETGLKSGMILKIPFSEDIPAIVGGSVAEKVNLVDSISDRKTKRLAIMLPFRLNRVDFDSITNTKKSISSDPYLNASLDFYSGVLVAIDSLKKLGISLKVDVYDTKNSVGEVSNIIQKNNFKDVDAVIGPLTSLCFDKVASELNANHVPVVSPIGLNLKLRDNVFQSRPSDELLKKKIINFVKSDTINYNVLIVSDSKNSAVANSLKQDFPTASEVHSRKDKKGKDEFFATREVVSKGLKPGKNFVFLETNNEGFASNITSILASLIRKADPELKQEGIEIILVTTNINSAFEGDQINNTHLSKLQFHFASGSKEYNETDNISFVKSYKKQYKTIPSKRAVKGFDLTMDIGLRLASSKDLYMSTMQAPLTEYVENKFAYKKQYMGGYYNDSAYLVKHENLTIVKVGD
ncbi:LysM peptidoglycan-binding domain-containing protein [Tamlana sp. 2_MG-2023]|uniref:LysM peptidoglycan-binding domain-containing protein n=1 Tax=unclassified Tamlana TaxID=2614803 RepID=UPI0026E3FA56|nr:MULTISPECIES: LysM peptidoglycan-binding domain-containing protein [unclassified Tamlana]MDO6758995.1 LysM peptidoglycan-binding domain-containing protein [Tamlana sp. 2_MG-2023]MDO6789694.1 LysM peptidoglycan-binding domain-containing protein [Tamlana sp. 1_MG-2023]